MVILRWVTGFLLTFRNIHIKLWSRHRKSLILYHVVVFPQKPLILFVFSFVITLHIQRGLFFVCEFNKLSRGFKQLLFRFIFVLLFTHSDVKRLAEKEDWVVDNEGITSLVRMCHCVKQYSFIIMRKDVTCQRHTQRCTQISVLRFKWSMK